METINERVLSIAEDYAMSNSTFADEIGILRSSMSHIASGRNNASLDVIEKIASRFPEINLRWLISGIGPKYNDAKEISTNYKESDSIPADVAADAGPAYIAVPPDDYVRLTQAEQKKESGSITNVNSSLRPNSSPITRITVYNADGTFTDFFAAH